MRVLHIEDRKENRLLVRKVLESKGHRVDDAVNGLVGLELARTLQPELILVDINIPGLNGYEVITRLRTDPKLAEIAVVAITAEGDREHALALGFDGFVPKPIKIGTFEAEIVSFLNGRRESVDESTRVEHLRKHSRGVVDRLESRVRDLERANARLRDVDRLKMEVLRNVSHELATPMTPILGYSRLLINEELGTLNSEQKSVLNRVCESAERLKALINNLLSATRFATGSVVPNYSIENPIELIDTLVQKVRTSAKAKIMVEHSELDCIRVDGEQMTQAIDHLISNALKFGPVAGVIEIRSWTESLGDGDLRNWVLSVADEGPGIPLEERERVLEPFYQTDGSPTRKHSGAGLGLSIALQVVRAHGGSLVIGDAEKSGAIVTIRVPTVPRSDHPISA
jgi:signal transduction histidine kinase